MTIILVLETEDQYIRY